MAQVASGNTICSRCRCGLCIDLEKPHQWRTVGPLDVKESALGDRIIGGYPQSRAVKPLFGKFFQVN